jgi:PAS domain S-box-containing protein
MERLFHSLSRTGDGAFVIDRDHRIIFWNQAAEEILDYPAEEAIGRQCYEILGGRDEQGRTLCQRYCRVAIQADKDGVLPSKDVNAQKRNGEACWLNVTTFVYPIGDKRTERVIVHLFRDASERKEHQRFVNQVLAASEQLQKDEKFQVISLDGDKSRANGLTAREQQVLMLLAHGLGTDEVAGELVVSPATVRNHVQNILNKLGVHSRLEAVAHVYQQGLIETNSSGSQFQPNLDGSSSEIGQKD